MSRPSLLGDPPDDAVHVMTFNIRRRVDPLLVRPSRRWSARLPRLAQIMRAARPAVLGVQEALPAQALAIASALGEGYHMVGRGRGEGGRGEGCPIFVDTDRLAVLDIGQVALSDTPEEPGSRSWGNLVPRALVEATLEDRATGACFAVANTHLDHLSGTSRLRSARMVRERVAGCGLPAVVLGDLNAGVGSPAVQALLEGGALADAWTVADRRATPEWGTFARHRPPREGGRRIDWIVVSPSFEVATVGIDARPVGDGWASDHLPVEAHLRIPGARA